MKITELRLSELTPYARNPRKNDAAVKGIASSIKEFGFKVPIVIDEKNVIVCGHTRLKAAQQLGLKTVPCVVADDLTSEQIKAYRILDNKLSERAEWDSELLTIELDELELDLAPFDVDFSDNIEPPEVDTTEDEVPESPTQPQAKLGDVWRCGRHTVVCGDSTDAASYGDVKADMMFTDPPYGVSYAAKNVFLNAIAKGNRIQEDILGDHQTPEEMSAFWAEVFSTAVNALSPGASYYVTGPQGGDLLLLLLQSLNQNGFPLRHMLIWAKNNHVLGRCDYNYKHEPIIYGWVRGSHKFYGGSGETSLWEIPKPSASKLHPTMKPIELVQRAIRNSSTNNQTILDPFLGSGTTLIAAERLGRICYGIELEPKYVDVILQRYYNETGEIPVNERTGKEFIPQS